jgi:hypothetical protein
MFESKSSGLGVSGNAGEEHKKSVASAHTNSQKNAINIIKDMMVSKSDDAIQALYNSLGIKVSATAHTTFSLLDGTDMQFDYVELVGSEEIKAKTYVHQANKRQQELLNEDSMSDIFSTIKHSGQFMPGIASIDADNLIGVLDSSRRRMSCILSNGVYKLFVSRRPISIQDARYIAEVTSRNLDISPREHGAQLLNKYPNIVFDSLNQFSAKDDELGMSVRAVAKEECSPVNKILIALSAAKCDEHFCKSIVAYQTMSQNNVAILNKLHNRMAAHNPDFIQFWKTALDKINQDFRREIYEIHGGDSEIGKKHRYEKMCSSYVSELKKVVGLLAPDEVKAPVNPKSGFKPVGSGRVAEVLSSKETKTDYQVKVSKKHLTLNDFKKIEEFVANLLESKSEE